jgi:UDP-N-acetylmuramoyl-tripeptide--D-alanyl-D-alanine ligase
MATPIPQNRAFFSLGEILSATSGELVAGGSRDAVVGISTDTRALAEGAAFVALRGETHDGHDHLEAAARAGAAVLIVEREVRAPAGVSVVQVASTLIALGKLARSHARRWRSQGGDRGDRKIIGITGSAGKTTTRLAIAALLERLRPGKVHGAQGNLNNRIGVPMVLFGLSPEHTAGVIEMGMNRPGEIAELCSIAEPEIGVVTLIAAAHTELTGSIDGVAVEKSALFRALPEGGVAIGNGDDERVRAAIAGSPAKRRHLYGRAAGAEVRVLGRELVGLDRSRLRIARAGGDLVFETPLLGEAGALASAAAIAAVELGLGERLDSATCAEAFAKADVGAGAGRLLPRIFPSGLAVIDDSYNANPASSCASIRAAAEIAAATGRRLLLVLGEMRELGAESASGHDEVGRAAAESGAAHVFAVGGDAARIAARAVEGGAVAAFADRVEDAAVLVQMAVRRGDLVLVKGSRSIGTERLVRALAEAHGTPPGSPQGSPHAAGGAT